MTRGKHRGKVVRGGVSVLVLILVLYVAGYLVVKHPGFTTSDPVVSASLIAVPQVSSHNVTDKAPGGTDPDELNGPQYECTMTSPEMTLEDDSENGTVSLVSNPGENVFSIGSGGALDYWNDAYLSEGNNSYGYNSAECNSYGKGSSYALPVSYDSSPSWNASISMSTGAGFEGDAGFDIWLTGNGVYDKWGVTSSQIQALPSSTEIMVWLKSPGVDRGGYAKLGTEKLDGVEWDVLAYDKHTARHPWNYVVFAADDTSPSAETFTYDNLDLSEFIGYAVSKGLSSGNPVIQSVNAGFEWSSDPSAGTQVDSYTLAQGPHEVYAPASSPVASAHPGKTTFDNTPAKASCAS